MNPAQSAQEKPSAARPEPQPPRSEAPRLLSPQTQLRVRYYRRMNVQRVYPLTVEVPTLRPGQTPPPVVESVVVRPIIPGAMVVPVEQKLDPNRPGALARFHITPLAKGWLTASRVEVHHPGRPVQEIVLGSPCMSWALWIVLLILFFPIVVPLRLLLGPRGGPPRAVTQRPTWFMLFLAVLLPVLLLTFTRYAPMRGSIVTTVIDLQGGENPKEPPMPPMPALGVADGADQKKEEQKPEKKEEPGAEARPPMPMEVQPPADPQVQGGRVYQVVRDYSDQPGQLLRDRLETLFREQLPQCPVLSDTVYPTVASSLGALYAILCDHHNQREFHPSFWTFVILLLFTGLTWVTHTSYRVATRQSIDLVPRLTDAEAIETLPLGPNDRVLG